MITRQRIFHGDNTTMKDMTSVVNRYNSESSTVDLVATEDYLYIGSDLPFNSRYFELDTVNTQASTIDKIQIWGGNSWNDAVDVMDLTEASGKSFARSGYIRWTLDRNESWGIESTTEDIAALSSLKIYDFYWARISFTGDFLPTTSVKYVGQKFSRDDDLQGRYNDLLNPDIIDAYQTGKTGWDEQHIAAAEDIFMELRRKKQLWHPNQALDHEAFALASTHKTASIIYNVMGDDYENELKKAEGSFFKALNLSFSPIDRSEDGRVDDCERRPTITLVRR